MTMSGWTSCFQFLNANKVVVDQHQPPLKSFYHEPPPNVNDYSNNPSVFGKILSGDLPCRTYLETSELLAFQDRSPKAKLHALVIPKRFIESIYSLTSNDVELVQDMREMGLQLVQQQYPQAYDKNDYILCFHIPPFNSVDHLHMHVLAPASEMSFAYRYIKYNCGTRWCIDDVTVVERLKSGKESVPYKMSPTFTLFW